jgi:chromosome segregation ATPase
MAQENVGINITVGGNTEQALGSLKSQLRQATAEVQTLSDKFGATSEQAVAAAKRAAELKDQIGDAKSLVDAFNPDAKFKALSASLSGVAGGFAAVQGAVGLFGKESEDLQKTLVKVQSAMALSQGLQSVGESIDSFKQLGAVIKTQVVTSFTTLRGAIIATGYGALVVGIGLLVTNFEAVKKAVLNLFPGLAQIGKFFGDIINKVTDFVGVTSEASRALDKLEKTTKRGNESIEARIKILTAQGGKEKEIFELSKKQGENELDFLRAKLKTKEGLNAEELKKFRDLKTEQAVLDAQEQKRREDNAKQAGEKSREISNKLAEEEAARLQKQIDDEKKLTEDLVAEYDKRRKDALNAKILTQKELNDLDAAQAAETARKQQEIDDKRIEQQNKVVASTTNFTLQAIQTQQKATEDSAQNVNSVNKWLASEDKKRLDAKVADTQSALFLLSAIVDQNSVAGKAIAVAQAIINTYQGATKALGQGGVLGFVGASAVIAAGLINVKKIVSTNIPSAKGTGTVGGGASAPSLSAGAPIAPPQPQAQTTTLDNQTINAIGNQAVRAYVVENDVTSNQQRIAAIRQRARFG